MAPELCRPFRPQGPRGQYLNVASAYSEKNGSTHIPTGESTWHEWWVNIWSKVALAVSTPAAVPALFSTVAFDVVADGAREAFTELLRSSVVHAQACAGASECDVFRNNVKVVRVLRVENWNLWRRYAGYRGQMKSELHKSGIHPGPIEPPIPEALQAFPAQYGGLDAGVQENYLFHGTCCETAVKVAMEGFDFRLSKPGYYGHGTYFASQACKSHQYAKARQFTMNGEQFQRHTMLIARVSIGDIWYADKVEKECRRPPLREGTQRCYDCVAARPGPMPGHHAGEQAHQEVVVFEKSQAYPEFILEYTV